MPISKINPTGWLLGPGFKEQDEVGLIFVFRFSFFAFRFSFFAFRFSIFELSRKIVF